MINPVTALKPFALRFAVVGVVLCCSGLAKGQDALEFEELQNTLRTAYAKIKVLEKSEKAGGAPSVALQESAATAQAEAAELKERYLQLRGLLDALDISAIESGGDEKADRLIAALTTCGWSKRSKSDWPMHCSACLRHRPNTARWLHQGILSLSRSLEWQCKVPRLH